MHFIYTSTLLIGFLIDVLPFIWRYVLLFTVQLTRFNESDVVPQSLNKMAGKFDRERTRAPDTFIKPIELNAKFKMIFNDTRTFVDQTFV